MKSISLKLLFFLVISVFFIQCKNEVYVKGIKKINSKIPGQNAPNDMIFVQGDKDMPSYYIGVSEEPNINYVIYLRWLLMVYSDFPEVFYNALPNAPNDTSINQINEPFIKGYLTNPAYAYYPIVNLTWSQIQNYLHWKTDRLNEAILIKNKNIYYDMTMQIAENCFVTESYFNQQYLPSNTKKEEVLPNDGVLFSGFRLPTEAEWEFANKNNSIEKPKIRSKNKRRLIHPFGNSYYTLFWGWNYNNERLNQYNDTKAITLLKNYNIDFSEYENENYSVKNRDKADDRIFQLILDYPKNSYGVINMHSGVKEWLLDVYSDSVNSSNNWLTIIKEGGFNITNPIRYDGFGDLDQKDSLGHMQSFRYIGMEPNGNFRAVSMHTDGIVRNRVVKGGTWDQPGNYRESISETEFGNDIGFRCVLPYIGSPVKLGAKVIWDNTIPDIYKDAEIAAAAEKKKWEAYEEQRKLKLDSIKQQSK